MKRLILMLFIFCIAVRPGFSQWSGYASTTGSEMDAGLGLTWIDDESYYAISFQPDISIGKFGIGLNLSLLYNTDNGKIRSEDWDSSYDYWRIIRYLRYGFKGDPFYAKVGALDAARIGHGFILNFYNNQINYDERKLGLSFDVDFGKFGFETMTNNLGRMEVLGGRLYYRPLHEGNIPILKNMAIGASYITDVDPDENTDTDDNSAIWGVDIEFPLLKTDILYMLLYADHAAVINPESEHDMYTMLYDMAGLDPAGNWSDEGKGSGQTIGFRTDFSMLFNWLAMSVTLERRFLGESFMGSYYGPFYEVLRYATVDEIVRFYKDVGGKPINSDQLDQVLPYIEDMRVAQKALLPLLNEGRNGWFGALDFNFFNLVQARGSYQLIDDVTNSGMLHVAAGLSQNIPFFDIEASYDKRNVSKAKDIFTLDYRSVARVGVGYKIKPYLLLYMDYIWSFYWQDDANNGRGAYVPQERVQPRLALRFPFNL